MSSADVLVSETTEDEFVDKDTYQQNDYDLDDLTQVSETTKGTV